MIRHTILLCSCLFFASGSDAQQVADKKTEIGIVSYSFRNEFANQFENTLDSLQAWGVRYIEFSNLFGKSAEYIKKELDKRGMFCPSYGVSYSDLVQHTEKIAGIAKELGAVHIRVAWIPHTGKFGMEHAQKAATDFNTAGRLLKEKYGIQFSYHNHGYEMVRHKNQTLFEWIMEQTNPDYVGVELDILWAHIADVDPLTLLEKYGNRIKLIHAKDLKKGTPHGLSGSTNPDNDVVLGEGEINVAAIVKKAKELGVEFIFIEDESSNAAQQVPYSLDKLRHWLQSIPANL